MAVQLVIGHAGDKLGGLSIMYVRSCLNGVVLIDRLDFILKIFFHERVKVDMTNNQKEGIYRRSDVGIIWVIHVRKFHRTTAVVQYG